jgi:hypothetical protein
MIPLFIFTGCEKETTDGECEVVMEGPSYLKVVNDLDVSISNDFTAFMPLVAILNPMTCEIYGMTAGNKVIVIQNEKTQKSKTIIFNVANGETHAITVTDSFFN